MTTLSNTGSRKSRIVNGIIWIATWVGVVYWTGSFGKWFFMFLQAFVPGMLWAYLHYALRPGGPETP